MNNSSQYPNWFNFYWRHRNIWIILFVVLALISLIGLPYLKFNFSFEQFFPTEDEDLEFFREFTQNFETDDNFILISFENKPHIFDKEFLAQVDSVANALPTMPYVEEVRSLTSMQFPRKTPFGPVMLPVLEYDDKSALNKARHQLPSDPRFKGRLISDDGEDIVIYIKTKDNLSLDESRELRAQLDPLLQDVAPQPYHTLGRAYFQTELVDMQRFEVIKSSLIAALLISIVMYFLFRKPRGIAISLTSIALGLVMFLGFLSYTGHALNVMASLYPLIMIIVGTSDVIHIMSKYIDEGQRENRKRAMYLTIKEIGLATLFTSITTAIGFLSLSFSRINSIQMFGYNAAIGVIIAYIIVIMFTTSWMSKYDASVLSKKGRLSQWWNKWLTGIYKSTIKNKNLIWISSAIALVIFAYGISQISTNYSLADNLPEGYKVKEDFIYFEQNFGGYRPYEYALESTDNESVFQYEKMNTIHEFEQYLRQKPEIERINAPSEAFKTINMYQNRNSIEAYSFPEDSTTYQRYLNTLQDLGGMRQQNVLIADNERKARISATVRDIGADSIEAVQEEIANWFAPKANKAELSFRATGTGVIFDKNSEYVRESLLYGLGLAIAIVSVLMALLFKSIRMLFIALIPNIVPLLAAGALLGYFGIELEAGIAIIFAVVFGIAVDDTIHFLSKYRITRNKGMDTEAALLSTMVETGKAITLTSLILFTGFLILLFSVHQPTRTVGWLISVTLLSALIADFFLIPIFIRWAKKLK